MSGRQWLIFFLLVVPVYYTSYKVTTMRAEEDGYIHGCSDVMRALLDGMDTPVDEGQLAEFCRYKHDDRYTDRKRNNGSR